MSETPAPPVGTPAGRATAEQITKAILADVIDRIGGGSEITRSIAAGITAAIQAERAGREAAERERDALRAALTKINEMEPRIFDVESGGCDDCDQCIEAIEIAAVALGHGSDDRS